MSDRLEKLLAFHEQDPHDTFCTYGIAMEHIKAGALDEAIAWLDKTMAIDADYAYAYFQKARALSQKGDTDAARAVVDAGIAAAQRSGDQHAAEELAGLKESL